MVQQSLRRLLHLKKEKMLLLENRGGDQEGGGNDGSGSDLLLHRWHRNCASSFLHHGPAGCSEERPIIRAAGKDGTVSTG